MGLTLPGWPRCLEDTLSSGPPPSTPPRYPLVTHVLEHQNEGAKALARTGLLWGSAQDLVRVIERPPQPGRHPSASLRPLPTPRLVLTLVRTVSPRGPDS
ncbi:hypothetical protein VULLAG_LOCUS23767 [Vulpes lagopus]